MDERLPTGYRADFVQCGDVKLHVVHNGPAFDNTPLSDKRTPVLLLHGFPEFWLAWEGVMPHLAEDFLVIVPDQRGYNKSEAPEGAQNYKARLLVADMLELVSKMLGERKFALAGHDWGASVAYALAINFPEKVSHLLIANGVHPACFQKALIDDPAQTKASSYFHLFRREDAASYMVEDDFRRAFGMFENFSKAPWLDVETKAKYRAAWQNKSRMAAMLHWYNSSPIVVPEAGKPVPEAPLYHVGPDQFRIPMSHTLVWGEGDQALLRSAQCGLEAYCDDLRRVEIPDADHWILHTHGELVADEIRKLAAS